MKYIRPINERRFNNLKIEFDGILTKGSNIIVKCICDCGRSVEVIANKVISGHTKSCGKCNVIDGKNLIKRKFGSLRVMKPIDVSKGSGKKINWVCDCGTIIEAVVRHVVSGKQTSCHSCRMINARKIISAKSKHLSIKHPIITTKEFATESFGKLRIEYPKNMAPSSNQRVTWICECGRKTHAAVCKVVSGHTKSCGLCNIIKIDQSKQFGALRIKHQINSKPYSVKLVEWVCSCGNETIKPVASVLSGNTTTCGSCTIINIANTKFGHLRTLVTSIKPKSNKIIEWICDCGKKTHKKISHVISGQIQTCGHCRDNVYDWYVRYEELIRSLQYPIQPNQIPSGGIITLEPILKSNKPFLAICPACNSKWRPTWGHVKSGDSLTCGCVSNRISKACHEINVYLQTLGLETKMEYSVNGMHYDIFVPSAHLLIEYNGTWWHRSPEAKIRDTKKLQNALTNGYKMLSIDEKYWQTNRQEVMECLNSYVD